MKKSLILLGMLGIGYTYAQSTAPYEGKVGINTEEPKATLDITAYKTDGTTKEGLLIPRLKKADVAKIASPETSTLVYVNDVVYNIGTDTGADKRVVRVDTVGFYYFNGSIWVKVSTESLDQGIDKVLVYTNQDPNLGSTQFGNVPYSDVSFVNTPSLARNPDYIYVDPIGVTYVWNPAEGKYVEGPGLGNPNVLFYKSGTFEDAKGKAQSMYRPGKIGVGVKQPISSIHSNAYISGAYSLHNQVVVDETTGNDSETDNIFNTLEEAVNYANTIVNNGRVRIRLRNTSNSIDNAMFITRDMVIEGATDVSNKVLNINAMITVANGVTFGIGEGYGLTVNQNVPQAFDSWGGSKIALGGYSGITWNFTANDQKLAGTSYALSNSNDETQLAFSRVTFNTNSHTGLGWIKVGATNTGFFNISYWQTSLPTNISYERVGKVVSGNDKWQNFTGSYLAFSGLDTANNNALVERMRIHTNGNVGIGTVAPTHKLHIKSDVNPLKLEGLQVSTVGTDKILVADAAGVVKTVERSSIVPTSTTATNGIQSTSKMVCNAENAGKVNYTTIQKDGKALGIFGFCMQRDTQYVWAYMAGGSNIFGTSADGAEFGAGL